MLATLQTLYVKFIRDRILGRSGYDLGLMLKTHDVVTSTSLLDKCVVICKAVMFWHFLKWTWTTGNNWGDCGNGTSLEGCGPQETFRACSDIAIKNNEDKKPQILFHTF